MGHFSAHLYIFYSITVRSNKDNFQKPHFSLTCLFYFFLIAEMCRYLSHKSIKLLICPSFCTAVEGHVTEFWLLARLQFHPQQLMSTFFMMRTAVNCQVYYSSKSLKVSLSVVNNGTTVFFFWNQGYIYTVSGGALHQLPDTTKCNFYIIHF